MAVKQRMSCLVTTHTHLNGPLSGTTRVSRYQKGKTDLDFTEARDSEWQWHQLGCMQVCTSLQTDKHASTPPLSIFTGRMPFLPPNQQRQSTEGQSIDGTDRETDGGGETLLLYCSAYSAVPSRFIPMQIFSVETKGVLTCFPMLLPECVPPSTGKMK